MREAGSGNLQPPRIVFTSLANGGGPAPGESEHERGIHLTTNFTVKRCLYTEVRRNDRVCQQDYRGSICEC